MAEQTATTATAADASSATLAQRPLIQNFPDDISIQIIARVPRSRLPLLSLVSKSWRAAVNSPELFRSRSLLRTSQSFLYLNIGVDSSFYWFSMRNRQNSERSFTCVPSIPQHTIGSSILALGPKIYVIGGSVGDIPSNNVWIFDCRSNNWEMGPRMRVARKFSVAGELSGKIYVMGGCNVDNRSRSINWAEVFDPETGLWAGIPSEIELRDKWMHSSSMIGSRFYEMADRCGVVLDIVHGGWGNVLKRLDLGWKGRAAVVDNVLYCYDDYLGEIRGYDVEEDVWKELRGVEKWLPRFLRSSKIVNLDGELCVVWATEGFRKDLDIMCAEIEVRRDADGGLSGTILRLDCIMVVPEGTTISHCLAVGF